MSQNRNWPSTLRPARFGGAAFFVEQNEVATGRRLVVHEFPHKDAPYVEDMGRKSNTVSVTAYVAGDDADKAAQTLRASCERRGPQRLSLPLEQFTAHCESCSRSFERDRLGFVAFSLSFVLDGLGSAPFALPASIRQIEWLAGQMGGTLGAFFAARFRTLGSSRAVSENAVATIRDLAGTAAVILAGVEFKPVWAPLVRARIADLARNAGELAQQGATGDLYATRSSIERSTSEQSSLPAEVAGLMQDIREGAANDHAAIQALGLLSEYVAPGEEFPPESRSAFQRAANRSAITTLVRAAAAVEYAAVQVARDFHDRPAAIQARADVSVVFDRCIAPLTGAPDLELFEALADIGGQTTETLTQVIATLAEVITVTTPRRLPAVVLSQRLYGTANRARELAARNRVDHPGFMPVEFEALAV